MCGICGILSRSPLTDSDVSAVAEMNRALTHRGPDSSGTYRSSHVAMAMRRLKIIDLTGGDQPLYNEDGSLVLIANGEIYNHIELRKELEQKGHRFKTHSDCETILHLYEDMAEGCVQKLRGMFAFALYDQNKEKLFIARDRLGEKPLYYYKTDREFVFSSEMKSLLTYLRPKGIRINPNALNLYFHYQYVPEPHTCIENVFKLPAAHYGFVSLLDFSFSLTEYWDITQAKPVAGKPSEIIRDAFAELAALIVRADVPVGIALSGGVDSSAIAAVSSKHSREPMHAFSVGYPGRPDNDERRAAKESADRLGLKYHDVELRTKDLVDFFPDLVSAMDDPIADIAAYGYYAVHRLAREHGVPVLLNGFGGDELFWGYDWVRRAVERNLQKKDTRRQPGKRRFRWNSIVDATGRFGKRDILHHPMRSLGEFIHEAETENAKFSQNPDRYIFYDSLGDFSSAWRRKSFVCTGDFLRKVDDELLYSSFTDQNWDDVPVMICKFLFQVWLFSNCVTLGDRLSMASSVETRLPFLDFRFVETVMGLRRTHGDDYRLGHKAWFIDAMKDIVPPEVFGRKKQGFTPPSEEWYREVLKRYTPLCHEGYLVTNGILRKDRMSDFLKNATAGRDLFFAYKIVLLEVWLRSFIVGERCA